MADESKSNQKFKKQATFDLIMVQDDDENDENERSDEMDDFPADGSKENEAQTLKSASVSHSHFAVNEKERSSLNNHYESKDIKIFKDVIFIENKQCMIIKTWEKLENKYTKDSCHIKTLRIFDNHNHLIQ
jgi:hypothetical protein